MGAGASVQGEMALTDGDMLSSPRIASPRATPVAIDAASPKGKYAVPLEVLMDARWCAYLKEYIVCALKTDLQLHMDEASAASMADLSLSYLQFWLDVSDFSLLSDSPFRIMRGEDICERYLVHGAKSQIPLSRLIVEDIMMKKDAEGGGPRDIFVVAQDEAFEFLESEIFPLFLKNDGPKGYRHVNKVIKTANRLHKLAVQDGNGVTDTLQVLRQELRETLEGSQSAKALLDYMKQKRDYPELVLFYLEILDFKEIMTGFLADQQKAPASKATHSFRYFLMRANKIYDKYLKLGSSLRSIFAEADIREVVSKVSTASNMSPQAFDTLHASALEILLHDYFADFKESSIYRKSVPDEREEQAERRMSVAVKSPPPSEVDRKDLADMLGAARVRQYKAYLTANGNGNFLLFYYEVEDFKNIPSTQAAFVQGRAHKIFDKYIKRGAPLELKLDPILRAEIVKHIDEASVGIFEWAQHTCFEILLEQYPSFKMSELFQEMQREQEAVTPSLELTIVSGGRIDVTVEDILSNSSACAMFKKFAESEFCVEPLLFWLEVEEYKRLPRSEFLNQRARKIINRYIKDGAQCYITITPDARAQVIERSATAGPTTFQPAQAEVYTFLQSVLLPKYRKTEDLSELMRVLQEARNNASRGSAEAGGGFANSGTIPGGMSPSAAGGGAMTLTVKAPLCERLQPNSDVTLKEVLQHQAGIKFFKDFLIIRLCAENLLFWLEVEDFKNIPGLDFMKIHARKIAVKYITEDSKQQVNIDHSTRVALLAELKVNSHRFVFQKAQDEIYKVMNRDCFNQFLASDQCKRFRELLQQEVAEEQQSWGGFLKGSASARTATGGRTPPNKRASLNVSK